MLNPLPAVEQTGPAGKIINQAGLGSALLTSLCALVTFGIAIATPPISGPFCQSGCVTYPYAAVSAFVPHDYLWMYPGVLLTPLFLVLVICIHCVAPDERKLVSLAGVAFAMICTTAISIDYYLQIAVVQPSLLRGEMEGLALISQYNPHGVFIALEDLGYLMMSFAFLFIAQVFINRSGLERAIRWLLSAGALGAMVAYLVLSWLYGHNLEYRFEVAVISISYAVLIAGGVLLSVFFRRVGRN